MKRLKTNVSVEVDLNGNMNPEKAEQLVGIFVDYINKSSNSANANVSAQIVDREVVEVNEEDASSMD